MNMMKKEQNHLQSIVGSSCRLNGDIRFQDNLRIRGAFKGKVYSESGLLEVGEKTIVDANIDVPEVVVRGEIKGNIHSSKSLEIFGGKIRGNIKAASIRITEDVELSGHCSVSD